eukprot:365040-Chlamydomonas_euryale.AAC.3
MASLASLDTGLRWTLAWCCSHPSGCQPTGAPPARARGQLEQSANDGERSSRSLKHESKKKRVLP